ncbi:MAG: hypothetical protein ACE361_02085 [Aureliella sp.]
MLNLVATISPRLSLAQVWRRKSVAQLVSLYVFSAVFVALAMVCPAQEIDVRKGRSPHYVGQPVQIQLSVTFRGRAKKVTCKYIGDDSRFRVSSRPNLSQGYDGFSDQSQIAYTFTAVCNEAGKATIGPFLVNIDGQEQEVRGATFDFKEVEDDPDLSIRLEIDDDRIFVGERVPVTIVWRFEGDRDELDQVFNSLVIRSSLFDQMPFEDQPQKTRQTFRIETLGDAVAIDANGVEKSRGDKSEFEFKATRTMVADRAAELAELVISCQTRRVTSWERTFFGVRPAGVRPAVASSEPFELRVLPLPTEGRPEGFSGAVGNGFSISTSANRSVVRVGDPISLNVTIQGDGNLESLRAPLLAGAGALDEDLFELPSEPPSGSYTGDAKQFKIPIRVKSESVNQLPAIPFSWFNPTTEKYEVAFSKPIALQVMKAEVVSAADVVSSPASTASASQTPASEVAASRSGSSVTTGASGLNFVGANLAIEKNVGQLLSTGGVLYGHWAAPAVYAIGALFLVSGFLVRRLGEKSPEVSRRSIQLKSFTNEVLQAARSPSKEAAERSAQALRGLITIDGVDRNEAEKLIAECESFRFAPGSIDEASVAELLGRARTLVKQGAKQ